LIGSILRLLGLDLPVPDHTTLSRRADGLDVPRPRSAAGAGAVHLIVDSTGLKFHGSGEWLMEKHGPRTRRSWRKLHIGLDADTGQIVASALTGKDVDDGSQVPPLLQQVAGPVASFTGDGAYDTSDVYAAVPSVILMPLSSCPRDPPQLRARPLKPTRRNAMVTCGPSPSRGVSVGRRYPATTSAHG
jgi:hypothetical protein